MNAQLLVEIYVFVLAVFVGFEVISKIHPTLHKPPGNDPVASKAQMRYPGSR